MEGDEKTGARIIAKALEAPIRQIAANAGLDGSVVLENVKKAAKGTGFDAYKEEYVDMITAGIVDPAKVTRSALENAASVAAMVLTTAYTADEYLEDGVHLSEKGRRKYAEKLTEIILAYEAEKNN